jgi:opacity protein-like surface antigen
MKKTVILSALIILFSTSSFSQDSDKDEYKTLFGDYQPRGFYGAFTIGYSEIDQKQAVIFGGRFEWIVSHAIGLGFGGNGFINEYHYDPVINQEVFLTGGYGGFYIEPIVVPNFPVHLSFPILLGVGGVSYITKETEDYHNMIEDSEAFLLAEPAAELELNLTRNFRLALGASYRFTTPFDVGVTGATPVSSKSIQGWTYMVTFKFGRF